VNAQTRMLAVAAALAFTATAAACGSGSGTGPANQRIGGTTQGISIEVPGSFGVVDMTSETTAVNSIAKLGLTSSAVVNPLVQQLAQYQQEHPAVAVDATGTAARSGQFADNIIAYCAGSGTDLTGSSALPDIKKTMTTQLDGLEVTGVSTNSLAVGGVPGLVTTYQVLSSTGMLAAGQLEVAPRPGEICFVTLTTAPGTYSKSIISTAAQTAQFP
jgi:hypothetical protein